LSVSAIWAALGSSIGITAGIALAFSLVRPYHTVVYAPKLKHADEKRTPPALSKNVFAWIKPLWSLNEQDMVHLVGLDAAVFMRFTSMCRNIFLALSLLGCCIMIPMNYTHPIIVNSSTANWLTQITPVSVTPDTQWALVAVAWLMNITICGFLWWNYRKVLRLRRLYFESPEYQQSLHARTLMVSFLPSPPCMNRRTITDL
jgi:hypothetical protein